jgi:four helix bundle protein
MATIQRFEDLEIWKTARRLTTEVYRATRRDPFSKDFGLSNQIQRASVSVMSNVAEGFESRTQHTFIDYLGRARGSAGEVRSQLYVALDLDYITREQFEAMRELTEKVSRQIYRLITYLKSRPNASRVQEDGVVYDLNLQA